MFKTTIICLIIVDGVDSSILINLIILQIFKYQQKQQQKQQQQPNDTDE